jgi:ribose/xylose/arabinose/galactoside ABC-type transport system permease subunit
MSITERPLETESSRRLSARQINARRLIILVSQVWSWLFLLSVVIYFSIEGTGFFTLRNSQNILVAIVPILLMGLGQTYVIIAGGIDLSVGWVMGLASVTSARVMAALVLENRAGIFTTIFDQADKIGISYDASIILIGFVIALVSAFICGLINGVIVARLRVPPFIVTLGVSFVARGLAWIWSEGNVVSGLPVGLRKLGNNALMYYVRGENRKLYFAHKPEVSGQQLRMMDRVFTWPVVITFILVITAVFVLKRTQFGRYTYAIGGNREAALRAGVPVDRHTIMLYTLSGVTSGVAGFLYNARYMGGAADAGEALLMMSIAAVVIGGVSLFGGEGRMTGTVVGALILAVLSTGLILIDVQTFWQYVIVGIIIVLAVLIDQARDLVVGRAETEQV